ncbi:PEP-CTERM sorting domain-containing protein [Coraliomargarita parva]|uniref:PEP-CTERM sorting domain-containing protein n=1 Tax=Coraliomargarita parva TaxID=3014050 RepID=UPI0022B5AFF2|nr:PEP-CTERM sorting domain-containing protein [Coraliomargarita parva]
MKQSTKTIVISNLMAAGLLLQSQAADVLWNVDADGNWTTGTNWSTGSEPAAGDDVDIFRSADYTVTVDSAILPEIGSLNVGATSLSGFSDQSATLNIESTGSLSVSGNVLVGGGNTLNVGVVNQNGGSFIVGGVLTVGGGSTNSREGYYNLNAGTLSIKQLSLGVSGLSYFTQSGGDFSVTQDIFAAPQAKAGLVYWTIQGGSFSGRHLYLGTNGGTTSVYGRAVEFSVIGSSSTIDISGNMLVSGDVSTKDVDNFSGNSVARLKYTIDDGGVSKVNLSGTGVADVQGDLVMGVKGGAALTASTSFVLVEADTGNITNGITNNFSSALWGAASVEDQGGGRDALVIGYDGAASVGSLAIGGTESIAFTATTQGFADISSLSVGSDLYVYLAADAGTGLGISDLIQFFADNGLTVVASDLGGYDIRLEYADLAATTSYFAFDLSEFNSDATLSGLSLVAVIPEPATTSILLIGVIGGFCCLRRKRR